MARAPRKGSRAGGLPAINPKSGKPYSASYRARIERGLKAGKSRQEARGKKAGEYRERAKRETRKYGATPSERRRRLTKGERKAVRDFARERAAMRGRHTSPDAFVPDMEAWTTDHGFDEFEEMAGEVRARAKPGGSASDMWALIDDYDIDPAWVLYEEQPA